MYKSTSSRGRSGPPAMEPEGGEDEDLMKDVAPDGNAEEKKSQHSSGTRHSLARRKRGRTGSQRAAEGDGGGNGSEDASTASKQSLLSTVPEDEDYPVSQKMLPRADDEAEAEQTAIKALEEKLASEEKKRLETVAELQLAKQGIVVRDAEILKLREKLREYHLEVDVKFTSKDTEKLLSMAKQLKKLASGMGKKDVVTEGQLAAKVASDWRAVVHDKVKEVIEKDDGSVPVTGSPPAHLFGLQTRNKFYVHEPNRAMLPVPQFNNVDSLSKRKATDEPGTSTEAENLQGQEVVKIFKDIGVDGVHYDKAKELIFEAVNRALEELDKDGSRLGFDKKLAKVFRKIGNEAFKVAAEHTVNMLLPEEVHHLLANASRRQYIKNAVVALKTVGEGFAQVFIVKRKKKWPKDDARTVAFSQKVGETIAGLVIDTQRESKVGRVIAEAKKELDSMYSSKLKLLTVGDLKSLANRLLSCTEIISGSELKKLLLAGDHRISKKIGKKTGGDKKNSERLPTKAPTKVVDIEDEDEEDESFVAKPRTQRDKANNKTGEGHKGQENFIESDSSNSGSGSDAESLISHVSATSDEFDSDDSDIQ